MNRTRRSLRVSWALFRLRTAESLQYRVSALANGSVSVFWGLIEITVFSILYIHGANSKDVMPMALPQMVTYLWLAQAVRGLHGNWGGIDGEILGKINTGDIGVELCRPMDLYIHWYAKTAAGRMGLLWWRGLITIIAAICMPAAYRMGAPASWAGFLLFVVSILSAFVLSVAFGMLMTAIRIGLTWGDGPVTMLYSIGQLFSGAFLPLQLWPDFMQGFLAIQPFAGTMDLPLRLYIGTISPGQALAAIALQTGWICVFVLTGRVLMHRKLKNVIVQGG